MAYDILVRVGADITQFSQAMKKASESVDDLVKKNKDTFDSFKKVGSAITGFGVATAGGLGLAAKEAIDFESSFAGVRKTVDATEEEFAELARGLRDMSKEIPASIHEINAVAEAAGQLGIETSSILEFTRVMIDLGEATNLTSDEAAEALARFANITQMSQKDFDRLGATIVELGNNFATTERDIVEMSKRIAGAGAQVGMTEADIMALATALSSVGIEAEMGGSAISRVLVDMQVAASTGFNKVREVMDKTGYSLRDLQMMASHNSKAFGNLAEDLGMTRSELQTLVDAGVRLEGFAEIAGMSAEEFKRAFEQDAIGALGVFIEGLAHAEERGTNAINMLQELGVSEIRLRDTLLRVGGAQKLFNDAVTMASNAWQENTALTDEAEQRYATMASQLRILKNTIVDAAISLGTVLIPYIKQVTDFIRNLVDRFNNLDESAKRFTAIGGVLVSIFSLIAGPLLMLIGFIPQIVAGFKAIGTVIGALSGPIGWIILAIVGIVTALVIAYNKSEWFRNAVQQTWEKIKEVFSTVINWIKDNIVVPVFTEIAAFINEILARIREYWDKYGELIMSGVKLYLTIIWEYIKSVMNFIKGIFEIVWPIIAAIVKGAWEYIKLIITTALDVISGIIDFVMSIIRGDWEGAWNAVKDTVIKIWENIKRFFENVDLVETGKNIIRGLINGILSMVNNVKDAVKNIGNRIKDTFTSFFGIKSPSRLMLSLSKHIPEGAIVGIESMIGKVQRVSQKLSEAMLPDTPQVSMAYSTPTGVYDSLARAIDGTINVNTREDRIADAIDDLRRDLTNLRVEINEREFGRVVSDVTTRERNQAIRNGGRRRL